MKLFEVEWKVLTQAHLGLQYGAPSMNKKGFSAKDKAEEFYKKLFDSASFLQISGSLEAHIHEIEIE